MTRSFLHQRFIAVQSPKLRWPQDRLGSELLKEQREEKQMIIHTGNENDKGREREIEREKDLDCRFLLTIFLAQGEHSDQGPNSVSWQFMGHASTLHVRRSCIWHSWAQLFLRQCSSYWTFLQISQYPFQGTWHDKI